ncbi:MAG: 30S ribosomal protein S20 [Micrococcales bacterium]|nr:MAG: 30S ribosomal protein S20 [Micrococcales bacterium]
MANIKSQIKRNRTNEQARQRNKAVKTELKSAVRSLDVAVSKGVIHKNQAAKRKSAMAKAAAGSA